MKTIGGPYSWTVRGIFRVLTKIILKTFPKDEDIYYLIRFRFKEFLYSLPLSKLGSSSKKYSTKLRSLQMDRSNLEGKTITIF